MKNEGWFFLWLIAFLLTGLLLQYLLDGECGKNRHWNPESLHCENEVVDSL